MFLSCRLLDPPPSPFNLLPLWFYCLFAPSTLPSPAPPPHSLLRQQVFGQFVLVSEAAQRVHALQDVRVDLLG